MVNQETLDLFANNAAAMAAGDAEHLAKQQLPPDVSCSTGISYDSDDLEAHKLDIYRPQGSDGKTLPVIIDFHGGGLYYGSKENNKCRDMALASHGYAVINANYRLVPSVSFLGQIQDAIKVFDWVRNNAEVHAFSQDNIFVTGDSAGGTLALYAVAAQNSPVLSQAFHIPRVGLNILALAVTSGMFRLRGGVHATALSYYMNGYLQTPGDHIALEPYLDLDKLIIDGTVPPMYMITSSEDFIADNSYELARTLQARHRDFAMTVWPRGKERVLGHIFNITQAGDPDAMQAQQAIDDIARFFDGFAV